MKIGTKSYGGVGVRTQLEADGSYKDYYRFGTSFQDQVLSVGALVKGDKKSPNPWSYRVRTLTFGSGFWTGAIKSTGKVLFTENGWFGDAPNPVHTPASADAKALDRLNEAVRGDLDLSVDLAQARQVRDMVHKRTAPIFDRNFASSSHLMRTWRRLTSLRRGTKAYANAWLEFSYGWLPLVGSVYGVYDELKNRQFGLLRFQRGATTRDPVVTVGTTGGYKTFTSSNSKNSTRYDIWLNAQFNWARFSSLNPISIAWELVPYSFVVDWFYNVGGYVRALETAYQFAPAFQGGYVSRLYVEEGSTLISGVLDGVAERYVKNVSSSKKEVTFSRQVLSAYPLPRKPCVEFDLGGRRLVSAAALLRQLMH